LLGIIAIITAVITNNRSRLRKRFLARVKNLPAYLNILQTEIMRSFIVIEALLLVIGGV
jgi:hypothetical protein